MKYHVAKADWVNNKLVIELDDKRTVLIDVCTGDEEPCNIGTTNRVGYRLQGKLHNGLDDAEADACCVTWDFGEMDEQPDSLDLYDWQCESDDTTCTLEIWA